MLSHLDGEFKKIGCGMSGWKLAKRKEQKARTKDGRTQAHSAWALNGDDGRRNLRQVNPSRQAIGPGRLLLKVNKIWRVIYVQIDH